MEKGPTELSPEALNAIKAEVVRGYKSIPRRGAEVGGLLRGSASGQIRIAGIIPVPIEYRFGPTYRLSDTDKEAFRSALKNCAQGDVIGWYRSNMRPGGLTEDDRLLSAEFFHQGPAAFLLCHTNAEFHVSAKVRLIQAGKIQESETVLDLGRFSLLEQALQELDNESAEPPQPVQPTPHHVPPPMVAPPVSEAPGFATVASSAATRRVSAAGRFALIGSVSIAMIFAAGLFLRNQVASSGGNSVQAESLGLGMKVDRQGNALLVSWNRQAPEIVQASGATFRIVEGARIRLLQLSSSELHTGGILYTPGGEDVNMELEIHGPAGNFTQSIRVIGDVASTRDAASPVTRLKAAEHREPELVGRDAIDASVIRDIPASEERANASPRPFTPPPTRAAAEPIVALAEPPALSPANLSGTVPAGLHTSLPQVAPQQVRQSLFPSLSTPATTPAPASPQFIPARAIRSVQPAVQHGAFPVPSSAFSQSRAPQEVQVDVTIDVRGNVTKAAISKITGSAGNLLAAPALDAARRWQFSPAMLGGRPVESHMTLKFVFSNNAN
ncbi:MAG TPA: TonB family protein [Bryobacteraceae bacterium]|nr:TonB family protein [Bryobacteraceae bacterium]